MLKQLTNQYFKLSYGGTKLEVECKHFEQNWCELKINNLSVSMSSQVCFLIQVDQVKKVFLSINVCSSSLKQQVLTSIFGRYSGANMFDAGVFKNLHAILPSSSKF